MAIRIDEQGREWQTITNEDGTEFEIEINKKPVIVKVDEAKKRLRNMKIKLKNQS